MVRHNIEPSSYSLPDKKRPAPPSEIAGAVVRCYPVGYPPACEYLAVTWHPTNILDPVAETIINRVEPLHKVDEEEEGREKTIRETLSDHFVLLSPGSLTLLQL